MRQAAQGRPRLDPVQPSRVMRSSAVMLIDSRHVAGRRPDQRVNSCEHLIEFFLLIQCPRIDPDGSVGGVAAQPGARVMSLNSSVV